MFLHVFNDQSIRGLGQVFLCLSLFMAVGAVLGGIFLPSRTPNNVLRRPASLNHEGGEQNQAQRFGRHNAGVLATSKINDITGWELVGRCSWARLLLTN